MLVIIVLCIWYVIGLILVTIRALKEHDIRVGDVPLLLIGAIIGPLWFTTFIDPKLFKTKIIKRKWFKH